MFNIKSLSKHTSERLKSMQEEIEILSAKKYATGTIYSWRREISKGNRFYWNPLRSTALSLVQSESESDNYCYDSGVIIPPITVKTAKNYLAKIIDIKLSIKSRQAF